MAVKSSYIFIFLFVFCHFSPYFASKSEESSTKPLRVSMQKFQDDERVVFVLDNVFSPELLRSYYSIASFGNIQGMVSPWQYSYEDYYFKIQLANSTTHIPWISPIEHNFFVTSKVWAQIKKLTEKISGGKVYYPKDVFISMIRRLDFTTVDNTDDGSEMTARLLLAPRLKKNDYGESVFYKKNGEILAAVFPKFGRLLLWNSSVPYTYKPPAMSYLQGLYSITIKLTTSEEAMKQGALKTKEKLSNINKYELMDFPLTDGKPLEDKAIENHLTRKIHDHQGRDIAYFDGLISKGDLDALRLFLLHYNSAYAYQGYDESPDTEHDNVSWIVGIKVAKFVKSRLWKEITRALEFLSGQKGWYPYDVSMNVIRNSHYTRIHEDCEEHEDEFTILMYLTPDWKPEYFGETAFFDERMQPNGEPYPKGHRQYDWITSISPRYGRIAIFRGIIPHSARPPSAGFKGARYTFACKVSRTYRIAHAKMLRETIEDVEPGDPDFDLLQDLQTGKYDTPSTDKPVEFLEQELAKRKKNRADKLLEMKTAFVKRVTS